MTTIHMNVARKVLHPGVKMLTVFYAAEFDNDRTREGFLSRLLYLKKLTDFSFYTVERLGDFSRLIYRSHVSMILSYLNLHGFLPDSIRAKRFAKYFCWSNVKTVFFNSSQGRHHKWFGLFYLANCYNFEQFHKREFLAFRWVWIRTVSFRSETQE